MCGCKKQCVFIKWVLDSEEIKDFVLVKDGNCPLPKQYNESQMKAALRLRALFWTFFKSGYETECGDNCHCSEDLASRKPAANEKEAAKEDIPVKFTWQEFASIGDPPTEVECDYLVKGKMTLKKYRWTAECMPDELTMSVDTLSDLDVTLVSSNGEAVSHEALERIAQILHQDRVRRS